MKTTSIAAILALAIYLPFAVAQIPPTRTAKPLQPVAPSTAADKAKLAEWEKVLHVRRPQGSSKQAAQKQVEDFSAKQTAIAAIATAPERAHCVPLLSTVVADKDEDPKVRENALTELLGIANNYVLPAPEVDTTYGLALTLAERRNDAAVTGLRLNLIALAQTTLQQPQLPAPKKKANLDRLTQFLARENAASASIIRDAEAKIQRVNASSTGAEQHAALKALEALDKIVADQNLSELNRQSLLKLLTGALNKRFSQFYHFSSIAQSLEKLGDPAAIPALEAFLKAHPSEKIDPNVTAYVLGLARRAVQTLQAQAGGKK